MDYIACIFIFCAYTVNGFCMVINSAAKLFIIVTNELGVFGSGTSVTVRKAESVNSILQGPDGLPVAGCWHKVQ